jgi:2-polyprenyl-3-methyl-5-hydroxy-6-metoxy-1,4-benzoquinol methylase
MVHDERWKAERDFFDAEEYSQGPVPANTIERYTLCRKPFLPAEYPFWILGDIRGKRILELGSGDGGNSVLLALKGATVCGIDISPRAVEIATRRARMHGVGDRVTFHALPLESYVRQTEEKFDIICGFAILHHLLPVLDELVIQMKRLAHPQTAFLFAEPVSLSRRLRQLRLALPLRIHATPGERPLEPQDLAILRRHLPNLQVEYFGLALRVWARFLPGRYEDFSPLRRMIFDACGRLDRALLWFRGAHVLASSAVLYAPSATSGLPRAATAQLGSPTP